MSTLVDERQIDAIKDAQLTYEKAIETVQDDTAKALAEKIKTDENAPAYLKYIMELLGVEKIYYATIEDDSAGLDQCDYFVLVGKEGRIGLRVEGTRSEYYDDNFFEFEAWDSIGLEEIIEDDFDERREERTYPEFPQGASCKEAVSYLYGAWFSDEDRSSALFYPFRRKVDFNDSEEANFPL